MVCIATSQSMYILYLEKNEVKATAKNIFRLYLRVSELVTVDRLNSLLKNTLTPN